MQGPPSHVAASLTVCGTGSKAQIYMAVIVVCIWISSYLSRTAFGGMRHMCLAYVAIPVIYHLVCLVLM